MNRRRSLLLFIYVPLAARDIAPTREGQPPGVGRAADPYVVYDTRPAILHGPYPIAPTETSVVVAWGTDTPSHSKVLYGIDAPTPEAVSAKDGLLAVGNYPIVIVGQDQVARVDATGERIKVAVMGKDGAVVDTIVVERKR